MLLNYSHLNSQHMKIKNLLLAVPVLLAATAVKKDKPEAITDIDLRRYAGKWYEIARLPVFFERKLKCTSAEYTLRKDGKLAVVNSGYFIDDPSKVKAAKGIAWVPDSRSPGKLKVMFFRPFAGDYWIMELDNDYRYVLVGEPSLKYLWILAREKTLDEDTYKRLLDKAVANGFDVSEIIRVDQDCK